ncbi:hypothetical protein [Rhodococcus triatomae]
MSEQNTTTPPAPPSDTPSKDDNGNSATKLLIGMSVLAVVLIAGAVFSAVILLRGEDAGPLVPADQTAGGTSSQVDQGLFEQDPIFDPLDRVVYIPRDSNGVILPQSNPGADRPATQAPGGVMLQKIHGNMVVPFSTSDGPTRLTDSGVAAGFSRTAQGAGLAAAHYFGYLSSGTNRLSMLESAGVVADSNGTLAATGLLSVPNDRAYGAYPNIKVLFHRDLTKVDLGFAEDKSDGTRVYSSVSMQLIWRDSIGWVVKLDGPDSFSANTPPSFGEGWTSWW